MSYVAHFESRDGSEVIAASFACPVCLRTVATAALTAGGDASTADVVCVPCGHGWQLVLDRWQLLRLLIAPMPATGPSWSVQVLHPMLIAEDDCL